MSFVQLLAFGSRRFCNANVALFDAEVSNMFYRLSCGESSDLVSTNKLYLNSLTASVVTAIKKAHTVFLSLRTHHSYSNQKINKNV